MRLNTCILAAAAALVFCAPSRAADLAKPDPKMATVATKDWTFVTRAGDKVPARIAIPKLAEKYPNEYARLFIGYFDAAWYELANSERIKADAALVQDKSNAHAAALKRFYQTVRFVAFEDELDEKLPREEGARNSAALASGEASILGLIGTTAQIAGKEAAEDAWKLVKQRAPKRPSSPQK